MHFAVIGHKCDGFLVKKHRIYDLFLNILFLNIFPNPLPISNKFPIFAITELVCIPFDLQASHFFMYMNQNPYTH